MNSPNPSELPATPPPAAIQRKHPQPVLKILGGLLAAATLALAAYSIYVASRQPDRQEIMILGQKQIAAGCPAAFRIQVRNRLSAEPVEGAEVTLSLVQSNQAVALGRFRTDDSGCIADAVDFPKLAAGEYQLVVDAHSRLGRDHLTYPITIGAPARVLLTTDKPRYQPGQTIHLRSLILNGRTQQPMAGEPVTFEICDGKDNKLFKETRSSSAYGIAAANFALADELNPGTFRICAHTAAARSDQAVEVKRYVLPKFNLQITTDQPYYLPGQPVSGTIIATYPFGRPVANSQVKLAMAALDAPGEPVTLLRGHTDATGRLPFRFVLPDQPATATNGADLVAEVSDAAGHLETKTQSLPVARDELEVSAVPEAGALVPGVENLVYVLAAHPDGPAAGCRVTAEGVSARSDAQGVCVLRITPRVAGQNLEVTATDTVGHTRQAALGTEPARTAPALLLRPDRGIYQVGETARLSIWSPGTNRYVFLDLIKDGQSVLTKSVPLTNHQAQYAVNLPDSLTGLLKVNAYIITDDGLDQGCSRTICVNPGSGLHVAAHLSQSTYRPGETARLDFAVTDASGRPMPAALGIAAVDESVLALGDTRSGLLPQLLNAETNLATSTLTSKPIISPYELMGLTNQDLAQAYLASLSDPGTGVHLDDLVNNGYIDRRTIERIREMKGTRWYNQYQRIPEYAEIMQLLDGEGSLYTLRDVSGPTKLRALAAEQKAYFNWLGKLIGFLFFMLLITSPFLLIIRSTRLGGEMFPTAPTSGANRRYLELTKSHYRLLSLLTLLPLLFYPAGAMLCEQWIRGDAGGLILLGGEVTLVTIAVLWQYVQITRAKSEFLPGELPPLQISLGLFWGQLILSRLGFALAAAGPNYIIGNFILIWTLASLFAPLLVLSPLNDHLRSRMLARGLEPPQNQISVLGFLLMVFLILILAAMLLPSLASAKRKSQSVSLASALRELQVAENMAASDGHNSTTTSTAHQRVRRDFPETLCWRPELITDDQGRTSLEIPLADSITTWHATIDAVSAAGKIGGRELPIPVFQDFFADLDLPAALSLGDQVSVPVTCYNYLAKPQDIHLTLAAADWFTAPAHESKIHLAAGEIKGMAFQITANQVGPHALRVTAQGGTAADAIERELRVEPVGQRIEQTTNGVLQSDFAETFTVPATAIPGSQNLVVKLYPSRFSEVVEGMDSIFSEPHGCFEQTSSSTYPNVLALDYLRHMGRLTPAMEVEVRKLISTGYQSLLSFEVPGGGFEWFGRSPAHVGLTAYGVMEFTDMARVQPVDEAMLSRTKNWLYSQQEADGSWNTRTGMDEWSGASPITAYVTWTLAESGDSSAALERGLNFLRNHPETLSSIYQKALAANAFLARDRADGFGLQLVQQLEQRAAKDKNTRYWPSDGQGITHSYGSGLDVETTALCTMALIKAGTAPEMVRQALHWLSLQKSHSGCFGSTQANILAIRALIQGSATGLGQNAASQVSITLNGQTIETFNIDQSNSDVMRMVSLTKHLQAGNNRLELHQSPAGDLPVQISGSYWLPPVQMVSTATTSRPSAPLQIDVRYDRVKLTVDAPLKCVVTVRNNASTPANLPLVTLGVPPGFEVNMEAFEAMQRAGTLARFEATGRELILYLNQLDPGKPLQFTYTLRAQYPLRVKTPPSTVYEYYHPQNRAQSEPVELQVASAP
jgi:uncharacterized protein YfaS (alpha-2-macroglobulin family)